MSRHSLTISAIRRELARLTPLIEEASAQYNRAANAGEHHQIARCLLHLEHLEVQWRGLRIALEEFEHLTPSR